MRLFTKEGCTLCDKVKDVLLSAAETEPHSLEAVRRTPPTAHVQARTGGLAFEHAPCVPNMLIAALLPGDASGGHHRRGQDGMVGQVQV